MSTRRLAARLEARVTALERAASDTTGEAAFCALVAIGTLADREVPVIAVEVNRRGERVRVEREPEEKLTALFRRANPSGSWRTRTTPVFGPMLEPTGRER